MPGAEGRKEAKPPAWLQISGQSGGEAGEEAKAPLSHVSCSYVPLLP